MCVLSQPTKVVFKYEQYFHFFTSRSGQVLRGYLTLPRSNYWSVRDVRAASARRTPDTYPRARNLHAHILPYPPFPIYLLYWLRLPLIWTPSSHSSAWHQTEQTSGSAGPYFPSTVRGKNRARFVYVYSSAQLPVSFPAMIISPCSSFVNISIYFLHQSASSSSTRRYQIEALVKYYSDVAFRRWFW